MTDYTDRRTRQQQHKTLLVCADLQLRAWCIYAAALLTGYIGLSVRLSIESMMLVLGLGHDLDASSPWPLP